MEAAIGRFRPNVGTVRALLQLQQQPEAALLKLHAAFHHIVGRAAGSDRSTRIWGCRIAGCCLALRLQHYLEAAFLDQYVRQSPLNLIGRCVRFGLTGIRGGIDQGYERDFHAAARRSRVNAVGRGAIFEDRDIAAFAQNDPDSIFASFGAVILVQLISQAARFHPDNRVYARVERLAPIENLEPDEILLEAMRLAQETLFNHKLQKASDAMGLYKCTAAQNEIQLRADLGRRNAVQHCGVFFDRVHNCRHHLNGSTPNRSNWLHGSFTWWASYGVQKIGTRRAVV